MKINYYKLGEYKIIEADTGDLKWEAHFGIGELQEGRCFRKGTILFIGPAEGRCDGFLKLEFMDHLKEFPEWVKTKYYCENLDVFHCKTGKRVTREKMRLWMSGQGDEWETMAFPAMPDGDSNDSSPLMASKDVVFRMQRYEINKKKTSHIGWKTYEGTGNFRVGTGIILEDILFMGSWQTEKTHLTKQKFLANLKELPQWNQTKYYCPRLSLHECKTVNRILEKKKWWNRKKRPTIPNQGAWTGFKNSSALNISKDTQPGFSSARRLPVFDSAADAATIRRKRDHLLWFKLKKSYVSKIITFVHAYGTKKWITYAVALIFLVILFLFAFLIDYWKEHDERRHGKKSGHSSSHHRDH